ncbi:MAG: hypothetical protein C0504_12250 [Candidatus Solibacter sp.]|nr:hypothetical protein [Candidatus Solibacter sp.]
MGAYGRAVSAVIRPGMTVVDLGCGSGVLGLTCLRAGAARVIAIDDSSMIEAARMVYEAAGFGGRVEFIRGMSTAVTPPVPADVVICDQAGYFGFDAGIVQYLEDARRRFLKPGGVVIPGRIELELAGIESGRCYAEVSRWRAESLAPEFRALGRFAENVKCPVTLERAEAAAGPARLGSIGLREDSPDYHCWRAELKCERDATLHGLAGWFRCELAEGVWMTNSPLAEERIQRPQAFLPLAEPVHAKAGDSIGCTIMARPKEDFLAWVVEAGGRRQSQSTLNGMLLGERDLRIGNPGAVPRLTREGEARRVVLEYCDGVRSLSEIEAIVMERRPGLLPSRQALAQFVFQVFTRDAELS